MDEHPDATREGTVTPRDGSRTEYEQVIAQVKALAAAKIEWARASGLISPGPAPRRKRGYSPLCLARGCPNGQLLYRDDEHPSWLDGRRKDVAYCSAACRQKAYRERQKRERAEWMHMIEEVRAEFLRQHPGAKLIPATQWRTWRHVITQAVETRGTGVT